MPIYLPDLEIGSIYNRWTVLENLAGKGHKYILCKCECGTIKKMFRTHVVHGYIKSCGCLRREKGIENGSKRKIHGMWKTSEYKAWRTMMDRCLNPNNKHYKSYGGRGINFCDEWADFMSFIKDMGLKPGKDYSLDRINNDLGYFPENCRWATSLQQNNNRRGALSLDKIITARGLFEEGKSYKEIAEILECSKEQANYAIRKRRVRR